jgi:hypothetical protein
MQWGYNARSYKASGTIITATEERRKLPEALRFVKAQYERLVARLYPSLPGTTTFSVSGTLVTLRV